MINYLSDSPSSEDYLNFIAQYWWEFEELVAHGEGNIFCEKPSGFDKLININVKFQFNMTKVLVL